MITILFQIQFNLCHFQWKRCIIIIRNYFFFYSFYNNLISFVNLKYLISIVLLHLQILFTVVDFKYNNCNGNTVTVVFQLLMNSSKTKSMHLFITSLLTKNAHDLWTSFELSFKHWKLWSLFFDLELDQAMLCFDALAIISQSRHCNWRAQT